MLDASAGVALLLNDPATAPELRRRVRETAGPAHVPELFGLEVLNVLRGLLRAGRLTPDAAGAAVDHLAQLRLRHWSHVRLRRRTWALRHNLTAYDAAYVALAEALDAPLLTLDARLADIPGTAARVELVRP